MKSKRLWIYGFGTIALAWFTALIVINDIGVEDNVISLGFATQLAVLVMVVAGLGWALHIIIIQRK